MADAGDTPLPPPRGVANLVNAKKTYLIERPLTVGEVFTELWLIIHGILAFYCFSALFTVEDDAQRQKWGFLGMMFSLLHIGCSITMSLRSLFTTTTSWYIRRTARNRLYAMAYS